MIIHNATKRTIEIRIGKKGSPEPEIEALIPIGKNQNIPTEDFEVMTIINTIGQKGRKENRYVIS